MKQSRVLIVSAFVVVALGAASCSSDSDSKSSDDSTTTTAAPRSTPGCKSTANTSTQRMTVEPCDGLTDGQVVKVYATGFAPDAEIGVTLCAADTDEADDGCDADDIQTTTVGAGGSVVIDFPVKKVLASTTPVDCGTTACVLSVGELGSDGAERADPVGITFAP